MSFLTKVQAEGRGQTPFASAIHSLKLKISTVNKAFQLAKEKFNQSQDNAQIKSKIEELAKAAKDLEAKISQITQQLGDEYDEKHGTPYDD